MSEHLTSWLASLTRPILVVGNGVLSSPVPEQDYATVIRINNYVLGGFSGSKVTHWVANGFRDINPRPVYPIFIPWTWPLAKKRDRFVEDFHARLGPVIYAESDRHIQTCFPLAVKIGKRFPTTGFCLLAWLKEHQCKFDVSGFDGMRTGHQADAAHQHGHLSTREKERSILQFWKLRRV